MPSKAVLDVLQLCFNIPSSRFGPFELYFLKSKNKYTVKQTTKSLKIKCTWAIFQTMSIIFTISELYYNLFGTKSKSLLTILYHAFLLTSKVGCATYLCIFCTQTSALLQFFNCMCKQPHGVVIAPNFKKPRERNWQRENLILIVLMGCVINIFVFFEIFIPVVVLIIPCLHDSPATNFLIRFPCTSISFRIISSFIKAIEMVPLYITSSSVACTTLVTLDEISNNFENLR